MDTLHNIVIKQIITGLCLIFLSVSTAIGQEVLVRGMVKTENSGTALYSLMVVNKRTQVGKFGNPDGTFLLKMNKRDTLLIGAVGYKTMQYTLRDTSVKKEYDVILTMQPLEFQLKQVEIFSNRDLDEIEEDIKKLGYNESDYRVSGVQAFSSPITFLYQQFSKRERSKRKAIELENESRRRDLLKELLSKYVDFNIIQLEDQDFDKFIDYCYVSDDFMKNTNQYDFIMYIKLRYNLFLEIQNEK